MLGQKSSILQHFRFRYIGIIVIIAVPAHRRTQGKGIFIHGFPPVVFFSNITNTGRFRKQNMLTF